MDEKNKKEIFSINKINGRTFFIVLLLIITIVGGTFAWFSYASRKTALVLTIGDMNDTRVILSPYEIREEIKPVNNYTSGVYTQIQAINENDNSVSMSLYYNINELSNEIIENGLKYTIVESTAEDGTYTEVITGDFDDTLINEQIVNEVIPANTTKYYRVYLWIDSSVGDQTLIQDYNINLELNGKVEFNGTRPFLTTGMIPVVISDTGIVKTINENDPDWYNYSDKKWANMVLVNKNSRNNYVDTTGVTVTPSDILAYYVWIPRYKYSFPTSINCSSVGPSTDRFYSGCYSYHIDEGSSDTIGDLVTYGTSAYACSEMNATMLENGYVYCSTDDKFVSMEELIYNYNIESGGTIDYTRIFHPERVISNFNEERPISIVFEDRATAKSTGTATDVSYYTHPAFTFGARELDGFWVGKFETTGTSEKPTVLPNVTSLRYQNVSEQFISSLIFSGGTLNPSSGLVAFSGSTTYGLTIASDSHIARNSDWGAIAYLSHSQYGINEELRINNNSNYTTGCGAETVNATSTTSCSIAYGEGDAPQSTTGNITGIYDMSGGSWEYVMANYNDTVKYSGFSTFPSLKYYDKYTSTDSLTACNGGVCFGQALSETNEWYGDNFVFATSAGPWIIRGGRSNKGMMAGVFAITDAIGGDGDGYVFDYTSWRSVITQSEYDVDENVPMVTISSTNNADNKQTVTLEVIDVSGITGYYVGKTVPTLDGVTWTPVNGDLSFEVATTVNDSGTWYFAAKNINGGMAYTNSTFYKTTLSLSNATINPSYIITQRGKTFTIPNPTANAKYVFNGWYTNNSYTGGVITSYKPTSDSTIYAKVDKKILTGGVVTISGTNTYNSVLTANVTTAPTPNPSSNDTITYTYQWYYNSNNSTSGGTAISGATSKTYTIGSGLVGKYIYVVATAHLNDYFDLTMTPDITDATNNTTATVARLGVATIGNCNSGLSYTGSPQALASGGTHITFSDNLATNAGSYTVTMTTTADYSFEDGTTSKTLTCSIAKIDGFVNLSSNAGTTTYGTGSTTFTVSTHHGGTLSVSDNNDTAGSAISGTTVTISSLGSINAGTKVIVTVTSSATTNYNAASKSYTLTINPAPTATTGECNTGLVYNGSAQTLAGGGNHVTYVNNSQVNAGNHTVTVNSNSNYTFSDGTTSKTLTCSITQPPGYITLESESGTTTYGIASKTFTVESYHGGTLSVTDDNNTATVSVSGTTVTIGNLGTINAGTTITVTVTSAETINYKAASTTYTLTINKATTATTGSCNTLTYTGSSQTLASGAANATYSNNSGTNAGSYTVNVTAGSNYLFSDGSSTKTLSCSIAKASGYVTLSENSGTVEYGDYSIDFSISNHHGGTLSVTDDNITAFAGLGGSDGTGVKIKDLETLNAGTSIIVTVTSAATDNYNAASATYTLTIRKKPSATTGSCNSLTYNGNNQTLASGASNATYSSNTGKNAGDYTVTVTAGSNYTFSDGNSTKTMTCSISRTSGYVTLTASSGSVQYGTASTTFTISGSHGGTYSVSDDNGTAGVSVSGTTVTISSLGSLDVGTTVKVTVTSAQSTNYNAASAVYTLTIARATTATTGSCATGLKYTGNAQTLASGGSHVSYANNSATNAGNYTVTVNAGSNYAFSDGATSKTLTCNIAKADGYVTLAASSGSVQYGTASKTFTVSTSHGDTLSVSDNNTTAGSAISNKTVTISSLGSLNAGTTVTVTVTSAATTNYNAATATYTLTIARAQTATTGSCATGLKYTGSAQTLASGASNATYSNNSATNAGTHTVTVTAGSNYAFSGGATSTTLSCTIAKIDGYVTLTSASGSSAYGTASKTFTVSGSHGGAYSVSDDNSTAGVSISGTTVTISSLGSLNAGTTITVTVKSAATTNYKEATATYTLTISRATSATTGSCASLTYTGSAQTLASGATNATYSNNSGTNAGSYTVTVTPGSNYAFSDGTTSKTLSCTIAKASGYVNLSATSGSVAYGTASKTFTVSSHHGGTLSVSDNNTTAGSSISGTTVTISSLGSLAAGTTVKVTVKSAATTNYKEATATYTLTINKVDATCPTLTAYSGTYDAKSHTITVSGGSGGTIQYSTDNSTWSTTKPTRTSAGTTTVYVRVSGDSNHNTKTCGNKTITISKASSSITLNPTSMTFNNTSNQTSTITFNGDGALSCNTTASSVATCSISGKTLTVTPKTDGTATITVSAVAGTNYNAPSSKTVSVTVAMATIVNAQRYWCQAATGSTTKVLSVVNVTTCLNGTCNYNTIHGLDSSADHSLNRFTVTWTMSESSLKTIVDKYTIRNDSTCYADLYSTTTAVRCYDSANSSDDYGWTWTTGTSVYAARTSRWMTSSQSAHWWYATSMYDCYMNGNYLS